MLKKWCEITSLNGIIDLYEAKDNKFEFIFWVSVMLVMSGFSIFFTYITITSYINNPSATNIESKYPRKLEMPDVLLCYKGGMNFTAMKLDNISEPLIRELTTYYQTTMDNDMSNELDTYLHQNNITMRNLYEKFGMDCGELVDMFLLPNIENTVFTNDTRCDKAINMPARRGACYIFKDNGYQYYPSYSGGISMILKDVFNSRNEIFSSKQSIIAGLLNGFTISLEKDLDRQTSGRDLFIPTDTVVSVTLNTKLYTRLADFGKCDTSNSSATPNSCYFRCYIKEMIRSCNCMDIDYADFDRYPNVDVCTPVGIKDCNSDWDSVERCQSACMPKCEEWIYETTVTYSSLDQTVREAGGYSLVYVSYSVMQYTKLEEVASFTFDMAVSNVGGQSGLWLGASFVTLIQGLYYIVLAIVRRKK